MKQHEILKDSWVWPFDVEHFVKSQIKGYSLNICAGESKVGDVRVDLDPKDKSILRADMIDLPFENCTFDTVIQDPPWKIGFYRRMKPFFECVRVCKVGGRIIYNAYWIPISKAVVLEQTQIRQDKPWTNTSIISVFEKITDEYD
jgi:ubiquinone/menaquinone biosynthesis C-methylase UbiE